MTGIFQNSKKREGDNSILENVVCWFLGVLCSRSHSKAHKRGVGTGARDMCLNNNSVVVFRWQIEMGDYAGHFLSSARRDLIRTGSVLEGNWEMGEARKIGRYKFVVASCHGGVGCRIESAVNSIVMAMCGVV